MCEIKYHETKLKVLLEHFDSQIVVAEPSGEEIFLNPGTYMAKLREYHKEYLLDYVIASIEQCGYADYWIVCVEEFGVAYCTRKKYFRHLGNDVLILQCKNDCAMPKFDSYWHFRYCPFCGRKIKWWGD